MSSVQGIISKLSTQPRPFAVEGFGTINVSCFDERRVKWIRFDLNGIREGSLLRVAALMMNIYLADKELHRNFELVGCNRGLDAWTKLFRLVQEYASETHSISMRVTETFANKAKLEPLIDEWIGPLEGRAYVAFHWLVEPVVMTSSLPRERVVTVLPSLQEQAVAMPPKPSIQPGRLDFDRIEGLRKRGYDVIRGPIEVREGMLSKLGIIVQHSNKIRQIKHSANESSIGTREVLSSTPTVQVESIDFDFNGIPHKSEFGVYKGSIQAYGTLGPLKHCSFAASEALIIGRIPLDGFMQKLTEMGVQAFTFLALDVTELQEVDAFLGRFFQQSKVPVVALQQCTIFGEALRKLAMTGNDFIEHLEISDSVSEWVSHLPGLARSCKKLRTFVGKDTQEVKSMKFLNKIMTERTSLTRLEMKRLNIPLVVLVDWLTRWAFEEPALSKDAKETLTIVLGADVACVGHNELEVLKPLVIAFNEKMKDRLVHLDYYLYNDSGGVVDIKIENT